MSDGYETYESLCDEIEQLREKAENAVYESEKFQNAVKQVSEIINTTIEKITKIIKELFDGAVSVLDAYFDDFEALAEMCQKAIEAERIEREEKRDRQSEAETPPKVHNRNTTIRAPNRKFKRWRLAVYGKYY